VECIKRRRRKEKEGEAGGSVDVYITEKKGRKEVEVVTCISKGEGRRWRRRWR